MATSRCLATYRIVHSPFGQVLKALRDNESRATSPGYDTPIAPMAARRAPPQQREQIVLHAQ